MSEPKKSGAALNRHRSKQDYATPRSLIYFVERMMRVDISIDLAATAENSKADRCFTLEDDSLSLDWREELGTNDLVGWLNPPFDAIGKWAQKCYVCGSRILLLVPASVGSNWYRDFVHGKAHVFFLNGRIQFEGAPDTYLKDCMIVAFGFNHTGHSIWTFNQRAEEGR